MIKIYKFNILDGIRFRYLYFESKKSTFYKFQKH